MARKKHNTNRRKVIYYIRHHLSNYASAVATALNPRKKKK